MKYQVVFFDADGTLFDYEKAEANALELACRDYAFPYDETLHRPVYREVNRQLWEDFERKLITQEALRSERFRQFFARFGFSCDPVEFSETYLKHLGGGGFLMPGALETVTALTGRVRLAIITNGIREVQVSRLAASPLEPFIEELIVSEEAGVPKPDPAIFEYAFRKMKLDGMPGEEVLIVGDSLSSDIQGGIRYGIDTCWFNPQRTGNAGTLVPTYEIDDLTRIPQLLEL